MGEEEALVLLSHFPISANFISRVETSRDEILYLACNSSRPLVVSGVLFFICQKEVGGTFSSPDKTVGTNQPSQLAHGLLLAFA